MFKRRVVVTGIGIISPLGLGQKNNWKRLISGESGIDTIKSFEASDLACKIGGEIPLGSFKEGKLDLNAPTKPTSNKSSIAKLPLDLSEYKPGVKPNTGGLLVALMQMDVVQLFEGDYNKWIKEKAKLVKVM